MLPDEINTDINKAAFVVPSRKVGKLTKYNQQKLKNHIETQRKLYREFKRKCKGVDKIMKRLKEENEYEKERDRLEEEQNRIADEEINRDEEEQQNNLAEKEINPDEEKVQNSLAEKINLKKRKN